MPGKTQTDSAPRTAVESLAATSDRGLTMAPKIKFDVAFALSLYDSGMSCRQIGPLVGCTGDNVQYHIRKVRTIRQQGFYSKGEKNANYGKRLSPEQIKQRTISRKLTSPAKNKPSYREAEVHPVLGITERAWLRLLIKQNGFRCSVTGKRGSTLAAHHLFSVKHYPEKRWDGRYVVVILKQIHVAFHKYMGGARIACTPEDWNQFLHLNTLHAALGGSVERLMAV